MDYTQILVAAIPVLGSIVLALIDRSRVKGPEGSDSERSRGHSASTIAIISSGFALASAIWLLYQIQSLNQRFQFLPSSEYKILWNANKIGAVHTEDVSSLIPKSAKAVLMNVIVHTTNESDSGSFVCADSAGNFNDSIAHYSNISVTEYGSEWSGGLVICPVSNNRTFRWKLIDNNSAPNPSVNVQSYGSLVGWL